MPFSYDEWSDMQREMWGEEPAVTVTTNCDGCGHPVEDPVELRTRRPSDPADLCCVMAGCEKCFGAPERVKDHWGSIPSRMTAQDWEKWVEKYGPDNGILWLT